MMIKSYWCFPSPFPQILHPSLHILSEQGDRQVCMYCACFYRRFPQGKPGGFQKTGAIENSLFCLTVPCAMPQDFSPHPQCAQAQQDLALSCLWKGGSGLLTKAGGGQVLVWQHSGELDCSAFCILQLWPSPPAHHSFSCRAAELMESLQLLLCSLLLPSALPPIASHRPEWDGGWAPLCQYYRVWPCQPTLVLGHLGSVISILFFPIQFKFVAVHWSVGFSRLLGTDGSLVSQNRVNSLLCLSLCLLLRSDQHSTVIEEGLRETGTKSECWRRQLRRLFQNQ